MTYRGKPSGNCSRCRSRKIRCDKNPAGCRQCARISEICPGYPDPQTVLFHHETNHVIGKSKAKWKKAAETRDRQNPLKHKPGYPLKGAVAEQFNQSSRAELEEVQGSSSNPVLYQDSPDMLHDNVAFNDNSEVEYVNLLSPQNSLPVAMNDLGLNHFMGTAVSPRVGASRGYLDFISDVCLKDSHNEAILSAASAIGLARISNITQVPQWLSQSQAMYIKAVQLVNRSLESTENAILDSTLMAVLVLGMYDQSAETKDSGGGAWISHAHGAASLIAVRGADQFTRPLGIRLFSQVLDDLIVACIMQRTPMPSHMVVWRDAINQSGCIDPNDLAWHLCETHIHFINFISAEHDSTPLENFMSEALVIDEEFKHILHLLLLEGRYLTIIDPSADSSLVYNNRYDIYQNPQSMKVWNGARTGRMILHELLQQRTLKHVIDQPGEMNPAHFTVQLQNSVEVMLQMRDQILATLPQILGSPHSQLVLNTCPFPVRFNHDHSNTSRTSSGSRFPMIFFYNLAKLPVATRSDRIWIANRMNAIWNETGLFRARELALKIEELELEGT